MAGMTGHRPTPPPTCGQPVDTSHRVCASPSAMSLRTFCSQPLHVAEGDAVTTSRAFRARLRPLRSTKLHLAHRKPMFMERKVCPPPTSVLTVDPHPFPPEDESCQPHSENEQAPLPARPSPTTGRRPVLLSVALSCSDQALQHPMLPLFWECGGPVCNTPPSLHRQQMTGAPIRSPQQVACGCRAFLSLSVFEEGA